LTPRHGGLFYDLVTFDTIIRNSRWFDGTGAPSAVRNLGIRDGHIVAITPHDLDEAGCPRVIDATGKWVLPGMIDIHTHYDVEVLNGPSLSESLRHGVTTVMLGSCSLSTVYVDGVDAGDIFGRVEAIPRDHVIGAVDEHKMWTNCEEYIQALEARPLGPNLAAFIGHSDMRTATMGLDRATQKRQRPSRSEQAQMERMLKEALEAGFVGMSSQQLLFDKLDGDVCRSRTLPSTYAKPRELRRLKSLLRRAGRILQSGPDIGNPLNLGSQVVQSLGFFRNPLKTSLLSAADVKANPYAIKMMARSRGSSTDWVATSAGSTCRFRSRSMPMALTWSSSRSSAPALRRCICATRWNATSCCATRPTDASSASSTRVSSASGCGTATSSTPTSSTAPTPR
jgi:N-acyl-D-aspartate/D-glutamate deacylase